jgi:hypothetical protein
LLRRHRCNVSIAFAMLCGGRDTAQTDSSSTAKERPSARTPGLNSCITEDSHTQVRTSPQAEHVDVQQFAQVVAARAIAASLP